MLGRVGGLRQSYHIAHIYGVPILAAEAGGGVYGYGAALCGGAGFSGDDVECAR